MFEKERDEMRVYKEQDVSVQLVEMWDKGNLMFFFSMYSNALNSFNKSFWDHLQNRAQCTSAPIYNLQNITELTSTSRYIFPETFFHQDSLKVFIGNLHVL